MPSPTARRRAHPWVSAGNGVELRPLVEGEGTALVLYRIAPGRRLAFHSHRFPEYGTVVAGHGRVLLEAGDRELSEGDSYYIPSGLGHGFESDKSGPPVVILHVAVGLAASLRAPMFRHILGRTRSLLRGGFEKLVAEGGEVPIVTTSADLPAGPARTRPPRSS